LIETVNLDPDGGEPIPWSRATTQLDRLQPAGGSRGPTCWLSTTRPDGRPHVTGMVGHWLESNPLFRQRSRDEKCAQPGRGSTGTFAISLPDLDLVLEGTANRVAGPATLERVASGYEARGCPLAVTGELVTASFWAPTAPPPPWHCTRSPPPTRLASRPQPRAARRAGASSQASQAGSAASTVRPAVS
jgi:hypothetical protein